MNNEIAIILAAGKGSRMLSLTKTTPKPLIKILDTPIIETLINALKKRGVKHIYVVVGYLKEQFKYLENKYNNLSLITNDEYESVNNISSIHAALDVMKDHDCFICEGDIYFANLDILLTELDKSCYFAVYKSGVINDWVFDVNKDNIITRVGLHGHDQFTMSGVAYLKSNEANIIVDAVNTIYKSNIKYENMFWDEVVNLNLDKLNLTIHELDNNQLFEFDTQDDINSFLSSK